jgi:Uma2 family endonuclease
MSFMTGDAPRDRSALKLTYDDFVLFPDDGNRHELIDGEHYVTPSPNTKHQAISLNLSGLLWNHLQANPIGRLFTAPYDVVFSPFDVVEPDLLFLTTERAKTALTKTNVQGSPDLVVEIGSPGTRRRDETLKQRLYERCGVSEYWVIDPELDAIKVYRLIEGRYSRVHELSLEADGVLTTPLLPGLQLRLSAIFHEP